MVRLFVVVQDAFLVQFFFVERHAGEAASSERSRIAAATGQGGYKEV